MAHILSEDGQGMLEYTFLLAIIAVGCLAAFWLIGKSTGESVNASAEEISSISR